MSLVVSPDVSGNLYSNLVEVLTVCMSCASFLMVSIVVHLSGDIVMVLSLHSLNRWSTASSKSLRLSFLDETR